MLPEQSGALVESRGSHETLIRRLKKNDSLLIITGSTLEPDGLFCEGAVDFVGVAFPEFEESLGSVFVFNPNILWSRER